MSNTYRGVAEAAVLATTKDADVVMAVPVSGSPMAVRGQAVLEQITREGRSRELRVAWVPVSNIGEAMRLQTVLQAH